MLGFVAYTSRLGGAAVLFLAGVLQAFGLYLLERGRRTSAVAGHSAPQHAAA
ncbi:hypothetical protein [Ornithinimicrobium sp. Y1694]|uniref:hypothetical protein n=1 Tax=Ornithinimicrobium sp. Y1694 TaxID=3418590 RepID=UPI003CEB4A04